MGEILSEEGLQDMIALLQSPRCGGQSECKGQGGVNKDCLWGEWWQGCRSRGRGEK